MAYVEVDVDLDEFDLDELVGAVLDKIDSEQSRFSRMTDNQKAYYNKTINELKEALNISNGAGLIAKTLDDQMKLEHLSKVFSKYTSAQIEQMLPD